MATADADGIERFHEEIMTLGTMPIQRSMPWVRMYARKHGIFRGMPDQAREMEQVKAAWDAHYRYQEKQLAFSRERAEQRALWLVPLIRWGSGAIASAGVAATVWMLRFS